MSISYESYSLKNMLKWKQHTIQDVHAAQKKMILGLSSCDSGEEEEYKLAVIDAWNHYAFTKFVPYDQVETFVPPPIELPSDILNESGYTRAERVLLIGAGRCLDPLLEITDAYAEHMRVIGLSRISDPLKCRMPDDVRKFVEHLRAHEDPLTNVEGLEGEKGGRKRGNGRKGGKGGNEGGKGGVHTDSVYFVRRFSAEEDAFLKKYCCYAKQTTQSPEFWKILLRRGQELEEGLFVQRDEGSIQMYAQKHRKNNPSWLTQVNRATEKKKKEIMKEREKMREKEKKMRMRVRKQERQARQKEQARLAAQKNKEQQKLREMKEREKKVRETERKKVQRLKNAEREKERRLKNIEREKERQLQQQRRALEKEKERLETRRLEIEKAEKELAERTIRERKERLMRIKKEKERKERVALIERNKETKSLLHDLTEQICCEQAWNAAMSAILRRNVLQKSEGSSDTSGTSTTTTSSTFATSSATSPATSSATTSAATVFRLIPTGMAQQYFESYKREEGWQTHVNRCGISDAAMSVTSHDGLLLGLLTYSIRVLGHRYFVAIDTFGVVTAARKRGVGTLMMAVFCLWFKMYVRGVAGVVGGDCDGDGKKRSNGNSRGESSVANQAVLFVKTAKTDTASKFWEHVVGLRHRHDASTNEIYDVASREGIDTAFFIPLVSDRSRCFLNPSLDEPHHLLERVAKQHKSVLSRLRDRPPALSERRRMLASSSLLSFEDTATHEIAATPPDWPVGVKWPVDGVWEACSMLREDELTCDVVIESDGVICKNVQVMYVRRRVEVGGIGWEGAIRKDTVTSS